MSLLEKISGMARETIVKIFKLGVILLILFYPPMTFFLMNSGYDMSSIMMDQLAFDPFEVFSLYYYLIEYGDLFYYTWGQVLDYGFMASYGCVFFSLAILTGREFNKETNPNAEKIGNIFGILAIVSAIADAFENLFILLSLANPLTFPAIYAILMSTFALIKWIILLLVLLYVIIARIKLWSDNKSKKAE